MKEGFLEISSREGERIFSADLHVCAIICYKTFRIEAIRTLEALVIAFEIGECFPGFSTDFRGRCEFSACQQLLCNRSVLCIENSWLAKVAFELRTFASFFSASSRTRCSVVSRPPESSVTLESIIQCCFI